MKYYFGDNRNYGADDIKKAFGTFVAAGGVAMDLSDGVEYDISALNTIIGSAVTSGVVPESNASLRLDISQGRYLLGKGKAVFADGGIAEVEEETEIEVNPGQYLYIAYSILLDDVYFLTAREKQKEENGILLVPIAYIEPNGSVRDLRTFAEGKVPAMGSLKWNTLHQEEFSIDTSSLGGIGYVEAEHKIDGDVNFLLYQGKSVLSVMDIDQNGKAAYMSLWRDDRGFKNDCWVVGLMGVSQVRATLLEKRPGYIKLRYYIPARTNKTITYKAWVGIKIHE